MNILIIYQGDFPEGGASTSRIKDLCKGLRELKHHTSMMLMWASHFNDGGINKNIQGVHDDTPYIYINKKTKRPKSILGKMGDTIHSFISSSLYIIRHRKNIDVLFFYAPDIHYYLHLYIWAKIFSIPIVIEQTELKSAQYWQHKKTIFYYLNKIDEKFSYLFAKYITVNSTRLRSYYINRYGQDRVFLIPNTIDVSRFQRDAPAVKGCIGYIGSFGVKDGLLIMIEAFAKAKDQYPFLTLKLMGHCENPKNIHQLIQKLHLQDAVQFTGPLLYNEVPKQLMGCDLLLMNRIDSTFAQYGFPNKLAEYMATGSPVIATKVSDIPEYFVHEQDIFMIPPNHVEALQNAIESRYHDVDKFDQIGKSGQQKAVALFDYKLVAAKLESVFQKSL